MKKYITIKSVAGSALWTLASSVMAHDDHGLGGSHWHATDAWGFVALAGVVAALIWYSRGGK